MLFTKKERHMKITCRNKIIYCLLVLTILVGCNWQENTQSHILYPTVGQRKLAKANMTYYIDPNIGSDTNIGTKKDAPWKTFRNTNQLRFTKGNTIKILSAGTFRESLVLVGEGTEASPIIVQFASGKYNFHPQNAFKSKFHISNANDAPDALKAIAFYFLESKNVMIKGYGAEIVCRGKVIETAIYQCENITIEGLRFDYKRPTVSELKVLSVNSSFADVQVHEDSEYQIIDSTLIWVGEGWKHNAQSLWQVFDEKSQRLYRKTLPVKDFRFSELKKNKLRVYFNGNPGFVKGLIYQNRSTFRDYAAFFTQNSKNITWKNVTVNFMHGMGFVTQVSENITFEGLTVKPKENSGRTCAAWADILHFSGCKGQIKINNSYLSAANDDAVNVHGTHLRIAQVVSKQKIRVRFMHPQSFGFDAFFVGDSLEFIRAKTLLPYSNNIVLKVERLDDYEFELTLKENVPVDIEENDVIENNTWTPDFTMQNSTVNHIPTRGVLVTTKGKVRIENNVFLKTSMSGILISNDANSWYESGYVNNVVIKDNEFIECGIPVINIHPENSTIITAEPVHNNIEITNNEFLSNENLLLSAKSTGNIKFLNNSIETSKNLSINDLLNFKACSGIEIEGNQIRIKDTSKGYKK